VAWRLTAASSGAKTSFFAGWHCQRCARVESACLSRIAVEKTADVGVAVGDDGIGGVKKSNVGGSGRSIL